MTTESKHLLLHPAPAGTNPELMVAAVLHLMSHYTTQAAQQGDCLKLASVIERHLQALARLGALAPVLRATCQQLSEQWAALVQGQLQRQQRVSLLGQLAGRCAKERSGAADQA